VKKAAVGAETRWVPILTSMVPLAKPKAARNEKATASRETSIELILPCFPD
jgi:hypothetical protein